MRTIRNCNVAVVGGAGFLGSHLVNHLIEDRGCSVVVIDNLCAGRREFVHPKAQFFHHDITGSEEFLYKVFSGNRPPPNAPIRYVFNYAAWPYVPDSFARPLQVFNVNAFGAFKVINAAHEAGVEAILQVSSAELYGHQTNAKGQEIEEEREGRIAEWNMVAPHSSYGAAKAAIDAMVQVRWREAKVPCIALRQFNCVGERETHPYVVPEIISQIAKHACLRCEGDGKAHGADRPFEWTGPGSYPGPCPVCKGIATVRLGNNSFRDFLYAGDAVRMAVELLERGQFGEVYNLGSEEGIRIYDLAKLVGKVMGFADVTVEEDESRKRPWEIWHLQSDNAKTLSAIGMECPACDGTGNYSTEMAKKRWAELGGGKVEWVGNYPVYITHDGKEMEGKTVGLNCSVCKGEKTRRYVPLEEALRRTVAWYEGNGRKWPWER